jgi:hypothetical protein
LLICALLPLAACGGGSSVAKNTSQNGTNVAVTFTNNVFPIAVAEKFGGGAWNAVAVPTTNPLTVAVPAGTTNYGLAYVCPQFTITTPISSTPQNDESVIEADISDGSAYTVSCGDSPSTGAVTGTYSASSLAGSSFVEIVGAQDTVIVQPGNSGPVTGTLATSTKDIAVVAIDEKLNPLAIQILRSQSVPGAMNGGSTITLTSANATTVQPVAVSGVPTGFGAPVSAALYITANGTRIPLNVGMNPQYAAVPSSVSTSGDSYRFVANSGKGVSGSLQQVSTIQNATSGGPVTLNLPAPLAVQAPIPAASPSFNLDSSGFSGDAVVYDSANLFWQMAGINYVISVYATEAFLSGSTNLAVPDLTSMAGFLAPAPSGTTISWTATISGGSYFPLTSTPTSGSLSSASDSGTYIEP